MAHAAAAVMASWLQSTVGDGDGLGRGDEASGVVRPDLGRRRRRRDDDGGGDPGNEGENGGEEPAGVTGDGEHGCSCWRCPASVVERCGYSPGRGPRKRLVAGLDATFQGPLDAWPTRALACDNAVLSGIAAVFSGRSRYGRCSVDGHGDAGHDGLPPALDLRMLGPLEAWRGGQQLSLGGQRQRSVLACLLLEPGHAVSSDRIVDAVWGARPPGGVQTTLQTYVFHLREVLEPARVRGTASGVIVTVPGGYRLEAAGVVIDCAAFRGAGGRRPRVTRRRPGCRRGSPQGGARAVAGRGAGRPHVDERCRRAGRRPAGGVESGRHRALGRGGDGARSPRRARCPRRPRRAVPAARAPGRDADARALPGRAAGGRAGRIPDAAADPRRRAGDPAVGRGGDPAPARAPAGPEPGPRPPGRLRTRRSRTARHPNRSRCRGTGLPGRGGVVGSAVEAGRPSPPSCSWPPPPWWARPSSRGGPTSRRCRPTAPDRSMREASGATRQCWTARRPALVWAADAVWATLESADAVVKIDPHSRAVVRHHPWRRRVAPGRGDERRRPLGGRIRREGPGPDQHPDGDRRGQDPRRHRAGGRGGRPGRRLGRQQWRQHRPAREPGDRQGRPADPRRRRPGRTRPGRSRRCGWPTAGPTR